MPWSQSLIHALQWNSKPEYSLAKYCVFHVQMWLLPIGDEKLRSISIWAIISHRYNTSNTVLKIFTIFIFKLLAPDTVTSPSSTCRISRLNHETLDISMKYTAIVVITGTKSQEIFTCFGCPFTEDFYFNITYICMQCHRHFLSWWFQEALLLSQGLLREVQKQASWEGALSVITLGRKR